MDSRKFGGAALAPRKERGVVVGEVAQVRQEYHAMRAAYRGGLAAEQQSDQARRNLLKAHLRDALRAHGLI